MDLPANTPRVPGIRQIFLPRGVTEAGLLSSPAGEGSRAGVKATFGVYVWVRVRLYELL